MQRDWNFFCGFFYMWVTRFLTMYLAVLIFPFGFSQYMARDLRYATMICRSIDGLLCSVAIIEQLVSGWKPCIYGVFSSGDDHSIKVFFAFWLIFCGIAAYGLGVLIALVIEVVNLCKEEKEKARRAFRDDIGNNKKIEL